MIPNSENRMLDIAAMKREPWVMEPSRFDGLISSLCAMARVEVSQGNAVSIPSYSMEGKTAVIPITGFLMEKVPQWMKRWGVEATAYSDIRNMVGKAAGEPEVSQIVLRIDSPGGTVAGVSETADSIRQAAGSKPMRAEVSSLAASGAYWLASQAHEIVTGPNAEVGSIGVFTWLSDVSRLFENEGVSVKVIKSVPHKATGLPGVPITDDQLKPMQSIIDGIHENFTQAVMTGRRMQPEQIQAAATGQLWIAKDALSLGLIDRIANQSNSQGVQFMEKVQVSEDQIRTQTREAEQKRMSDLKAAFPDDPSFAMEQFAKGASLQDAKAAYCDVLAERIKTIKPADKTAITQPIGAPPIENSNQRPATGGDTRDFIAEARARAVERKITVTEAMRELVSLNPEMHRKWLESQGPVPIIR